MGTREDAGELLSLLHDRYSRRSMRECTSDDVMIASGWDEHRLGGAVRFLEDRDLVRAKCYMGRRTFTLLGLTPHAVEVIEGGMGLEGMFGLAEDRGRNGPGLSTTADDR